MLPSHGAVVIVAPLSQEVVGRYPNLVAYAKRMRESVFPVEVADLNAEVFESRPSTGAIASSGSASSAASGGVGVDDSKTR